MHLYLDVPDAPVAPTVVSMLTTATSLTMTWAVTAGNAYAVDYYQLEYIDLQDPSPDWVTAQCDNLGYNVIEDWFALLFVKYAHAP